MARRIVITSGKGGVGKTTVAGGLGIVLAKLNYSVLLIDADVGLNNLDVVLGLENRLVYDLREVILRRCRLKEAVVDDVYESNLHLASLSRVKYTTPPMSLAAFKQLTGELSILYDFVLIDCPAGIDEGFHYAASVVDEALVVTNPHAGAIRDADKVLALLATYPMRSVGLVVNRVRGDLEAKGETLSAADLQTMLHTELLGVLPECMTFTRGVRLDSIFAQSKSQAAYELLARNIIGESNALFDCVKDYKSIRSRIKRLFGQ